MHSLCIIYGSLSKDISSMIILENVTLLIESVSIGTYSLHHFNNSTQKSFNR